MTVHYSSSTDTADDRTNLGGLERSPRRRDDLVARQQRAVEESGGADGASRRQALLRDALTRKDQEILSLKGLIAARDLSVLEAREQVERGRRERAELDERLRHAAVVEQERAQLARALDAAHRDAEQTAAALVHADSVVAEWRAALESVTRERDDARRQIENLHRVAQELRSAWEGAQGERQVLVDEHAGALSGLRAQHALALDQQRAQYERLLADASQRYDAARDAHTLSMREVADAHAQEVAAERAGRLRAEESLAAVQKRREELDRRAAEVDRKLAELDRVHEGYARELDALRDAHARDLAALEGAQRAAIDAAREDAAEDARAALLVEIEALRGVIEERDALSAELDALRDHSASLEALCNAAEACAREAQEASRRREDRALAEAAQSIARVEAARAEEISALRASLSAVEAERAEERARIEAELSEASAERIATLHQELRAATQRERSLEDDLARTREALGTYAAECAERLDAAERMSTEVRAYRERMTRRLADAAERLRVVTEQAQRDAEAFSEEIHRLTGLVGRLTARVVVQGARTTAQVRGARCAEGEDLDDAITRIADELPDAVAGALWDARDELLRRAVRSSAPC